MKKKLVSFSSALCLLIASLFVTAVPVAAFQTTICDATVGSGSIIAVLYEGGGYNGSPWHWGPDGGTFCIKAPTTGSTFIADFKAVHYAATAVDDGVCDGQLITSYGTWNDCVSSFQVQIDCHHSIAFYSSANYDGLMFSYGAPGGAKSSLGSGWNDTMSSAKVTYHSTCVS